MDPRWEYQAPQFVDFANLDNVEDEAADSFFDVDMESGSRVSQIFSGEIPEEFAKNGQENDGQKTLSNKEKPQPQPRQLLRRDEFEKLKATKRSNGAGGSNPGPVRPVRPPNNTKKPTPGAPKSNVEASHGMSSDSSTPVNTDTSSRNTLRQAVTNTLNNIRNSPHMKRLRTNEVEPRLTKPSTQVDKYLNAGGARQRTRTRSKSPGHSLKLPRTPDVMKRFKNKLAITASNTNIEEDFKIKKPNYNKKENIPLKAANTSAVPAAKAALKLTKPSEFKFATSERSKGSRRRSMSVSDAPDFSRMLRSYSKPTQESRVNPELTKPVPFPRAESRKRRLSSSEDSQQNDQKYKSMAEQISKFERGTPNRYRSKPRGRSSSPQRMRVRSKSPKLTVAKTPQLSAKLRSRPAHVISQEERELLDLEEQRKHQFHAKKVGETVPKFKYGEVEKKPCTVPEPFNLVLASKPKAEPIVPQQQVEPFHPKPLNKKILQGPTGVPDRINLPIVEPESPAFALKDRLQTRRQAAEPIVAEIKQFKAKPVPHGGVPVSLPPMSKRATVPQPFSFSERDEQSIAKKEEKIRKQHEEEKAAREFHAHPIPKGLDQPKLPEKKVLPATKAEPFKLAIEERVESRLNKWQEDINKELEEQKAATNFKATESKVVTKAPFVPKPAEKPPVEMCNFTLHTDRRAEERQTYELEKKRKEVDLEQMKRQQEERKKREEEEEVARLRKQAVHKAQPIRGYKPVEIKPSEKPLTLPVSPRLKSTRSKANSTFNRSASSTNSQE